MFTYWKRIINITFFLVLLSVTANAQQNILRSGSITTSSSIPTFSGNLNLVTDGNTMNCAYFQVNSADSMWIQFTLPSAQSVAASRIYLYQYYTSKTILLYASQDGTSWDLLSNNSYSPNQSNPVTADVTSTKEYKYYRFVFKNFVNSIFSLMEIELYNNNVPTPTLTASSPIGTQVNLSWNNVIVGTGSYELQKSVDGTSFSALTTVNAPTASYVDDGLSQVTTYWYRMRAVKGSSITNWSNTVQITTVSDTLRTAPTLTVNAGTTGSVALVKWSLPSLKTDGTYQLERSSDGNNFTVLKTFNKSVVNYNDSTVLQNTAYWYRVKAMNYVSSSPYSPSVKFTTGSDALMGKPTISLNNGSIGSVVRISWSLSPFPTPGSWEIEKSTDGVNYTLWRTYNKLFTNCYDSSLTRSTTYWYRVRAVNYTSASTYSNPASITTRSDLPTKPNNFNVQASPTDGMRANITWSYFFSFTPGTFEIEKSTNGTDFTLWKTFTQLINNCVDSSLTNNTKYWYRLRARNEVGVSDYSVVKQITTVVDTLYVKPTLKVFTNSGTQTNLSWMLSPFHGKGDGIYEVQYSTNGIDFISVGKFPQTVTSYSQESLKPNTSYWYRVRATNYTSSSPWSDTIKITTNGITSLPSEITDDGGKLSVSADNPDGPNAHEGSLKFIDNDVTTKWLVFEGEASGDLTAVYKPTGSYTVTSYSLTTANDAPPRDPKNWKFEGSNDSTIWITLDTRTNQLGNNTERLTTYTYNVTTTGTTTYKYYRITFTANNDAHDGVRFQIAEWQIFGIDAKSPGLPANLSVTSTTANSATLTWTGDDAKPANKFVLQRSFDGVNYTTADTLAGNVFTYTDKPLYDSTDYYYRVQALGENATAKSGWSNVAKTTTTFTAGTPICPVDLYAVAIEDSIVNITWVDRSYNETGFVLQRSIDNVNFTDLQSLPANSTTTIDSTVWPAMNYYYRIAALNGKNISVWSNTATVLTPGYNSSPQLTVPLLPKNACGNNVTVTGYISGLIPGELQNEKNQDLSVTSVYAADNSSAELISSFSFTPQVTNGTAIYTITGSGKAIAGDTASIIVVIKDNGGVIRGGIDSLEVPVKIAFTPLAVSIIPDKDINNLPKYTSVLLMANTNYPVTTTNFNWENADGIIGSRNNMGLRISPVTTTTYTVTATSNNGCTATASIKVTPVQENTISNVLTPNGDGKNDKWIVWGIEKNPNNSVKVFDRAGRLVFFQKNYSNNWDGTYNGKILAQGAYYYVVDFGDGKPVTGMLNIIHSH